MGEVEDYSVRLIDLLPCTTAAPSNITVTNMTATTAYVSWLPAAGATYFVRWRQGTTGAWLPSAAGQAITAGQSYYTITGLTEQTAYQVQVMTVCNGTFRRIWSFNQLYYSSFDILSNGGYRYK